MINTIYIINKNNKDKKKIKKYICSICLDNINKKTIHKTRCVHFFHNHCINKWLKINNTCPYCRKQISNEIITHIHTNIYTNNYTNTNTRITEHQRYTPIEEHVRAQTHISASENSTNNFEHFVPTSYLNVFEQQNNINKLKNIIKSLLLITIFICFFTKQNIDTYFIFYLKNIYQK